MEKSADGDIIKAIKTGQNQQVLQLLYKDTLPKIKKFIKHNGGSDDDAKDIFQDAVISLFNLIKLNKFDENREIGGFIYFVSRNLWINKVKKNSRMGRINETQQFVDQGQDSLKYLITIEKETAIRDLMDKVGNDCKELLKYSVFEKLSMREISVKMGLTNEGVAKTYNYRCKQKLIALVKGNKNLIALFRG